MLDITFALTLDVVLLHNQPPYIKDGERRPSGLCFEGKQVLNWEMDEDEKEGDDGWIIAQPLI